MKRLRRTAFRRRIVMRAKIVEELSGTDEEQEKNRGTTRNMMSKDVARNSRMIGRSTRRLLDVKNCFRVINDIFAITHSKLNTPQTRGWICLFYL